VVYINKEKCIECGLCAKDCFPQNIEMVANKTVIKNPICMKCGHCIAVCPVNAVSIDEYNMKDVIDYKKDTFDIEPNQLLNFIKFRRSVRQFKKKPVEDEKILNIIEAGRFTATGSNSQNVSYTVVKEGIAQLRSLALKRLSHIARATLSEQQPNTVLGRNYMERWIQMYEADKSQPGNNDSLFFNAPVVIAIVADSPVNAALAASNMELMAVAQGLGSLFSGFFVRSAQQNLQIKEFLGLSESQEVMVCMVLGYPNVTYLRTVPRKQAKINWR
jgi:nitroreductase/NAD-dependent dihydropyrimidine dehydrogenase PreA subunit